ncbi:MAG: type II secretion system protein GspG [Acidobacteria bacterium]|nr:type II secretion system protein GspG [Acidobacteriota bacterium]
MKKDKDSIYYPKRRIFSIEEQEEIAREEVLEIHNLMKMDIPKIEKNNKIVKHLKTIISEAPHTLAAKKAHWELQNYLFDQRPEVDTDEIQMAIESYLDIYKPTRNEYITAYGNLAGINANILNWERAYFYCERLLKIRSDSYPILLIQARSLIQLGFMEEGKEVLSRLFKEAKNTPQYSLATIEINNIYTSENTEGIIIQYRENIKIIKHISSAIDVYKMMKNELPDDLEELIPEYLESEEFLKDTWGNEIKYKVDKGNNSYQLASPGSDKKLGSMSQSGIYYKINGEDIIFKDSKLQYGPLLE